MVAVSSSARRSCSGVGGRPAGVHHGCRVALARTPVPNVLRSSSPRAKRVRALRFPAAHENLQTVLPPRCACRNARELTEGVRNWELRHPRESRARKPVRSEAMRDRRRRSCPDRSGGQASPRSGTRDHLLEAAGETRVQGHERVREQGNGPDNNTELRGWRARPNCEIALRACTKRMNYETERFESNLWVSWSGFRRLGFADDPRGAPSKPCRDPVKTPSRPFGSLKTATGTAVCGLPGCTVRRPGSQPQFCRDGASPGLGRPGEDVASSSRTRLRR
jgi:hypothetical protein